ncbi:hypothetical protein C7M84_010133 [Penaeus vannamei]|uniref:Squalene cyclase C-terminal domain-containing protein n=1 Tax=Penaeus vannamei TaxID=6689 RepID=A0A3R7SR71_PENVA|nr:hypothetical protein C7M84_010133 [Penaeus vannamei]
MVEHQEGSGLEVAFAQLATCTAGHHVRKSRIRKLLDIISDQDKIHSVDTLSVVILALHCAQHQRRHDLRRFIDQAMATLLHQQEPDGAFNSNLHSTALALQANFEMFAFDRPYPAVLLFPFSIIIFSFSSPLTSLAAPLPSFHHRLLFLLLPYNHSDENGDDGEPAGGSWNATRAQEYIMSHQRPDGSFGGLFDTNAVLPLLGGRTLLDVAIRRCPRVEEDTVDQEDAEVDNFDAPDGEPPVPTENPDQTTPTPAAEVMANITYIIWKGNNATENFNLTFSVPANTSFLTVMKMAAEQDERFVFSASHWGNGFYIHTLSGAKEQKLGYWFWLFYRLPEPPVPGTKPDNKYVVGTGVQETLVRDKDIFLFWFHQI